MAATWRRLFGSRGRSSVSPSKAAAKRQACSLAVDTAYVGNGDRWNSNAYLEPRSRCVRRSCPLDLVSKLRPYRRLQSRLGARGERRVNGTCDSAGWAKPSTPVRVRSEGRAVATSHQGRLDPGAYRSRGHRGQIDGSPRGCALPPKRLAVGLNWPLERGYRPPHGPRRSAPQTSSHSARVTRYESPPRWRGDRTATRQHLRRHTPGSASGPGRWGRPAKVGR